MECSTETTKRCTGPCARELPLSEFYPQPGGRRDTTARCKACLSVVRRQNYLKHREAALEYQRRYRAKHNGALNEKARAYRATLPPEKRLEIAAYTRERDRRTRAGIPLRCESCEVRIPTPLGRVGAA